MIPWPTGGKARAEIQAYVPPAQTPISQLPASPQGPWTRSPVAPVWRRPQPPDLMLTVCEEPQTLLFPRLLPTSSSPPLWGRQESGYRVNTAGSIFTSAWSQSLPPTRRLPRCAGLPGAGHRPRVEMQLQPAALRKTRLVFPSVKWHG